jgi:hypothetical protein
MAIVRKVICDCCGKDVTDDEVFHTLKVRFPTLTPEEDDGGALWQASPSW